MTAVANHARLAAVKQRYAAHALFVLFALTDQRLRSLPLRLA